MLELGLKPLARSPGKVGRSYSLHSVLSIKSKTNHKHTVYVGGLVIVLVTVYL